MIRQHFFRIVSKVYSYRYTWWRLCPYVDVQTQELYPGILYYQYYVEKCLELVLNKPGCYTKYNVESEGPGIWFHFGQGQALTKLRRRSGWRNLI